MKLRHEIWISLAVFAAANVLVVSGFCVHGGQMTPLNIGLVSVGGIAYWVAFMLAIAWWRCPVCGKRIDPPFTKKTCPRCGKEIDYDAAAYSYDAKS